MTNLLTQDTSLRVPHIVYSDAVAFQNMIQHDRPDVLLICESGLLDMNEILDSVITDSLMIALCIFVLHLGDSAIDFYEYPKHHCENRQAVDQYFEKKALSTLLRIQISPILW